MKKKQWSRYRAVLLVMLLLGLAGQASGAPSCAEPNLTNDVSTDTTYSGEVFIDQRIVIDGGATLTFEAGTQVTMCTADAAIWVSDLFETGGFVAVGTELAPIVFDALDPATKWDRLYFGYDILPNSTLQHVILNNGGGNDPVAHNAALFLDDIEGNAAAVPVIDHVSINDSGSNGLVFEHDQGSDPTVASVSNITISGSAAAAVVGDAGAMGGLSGNNLFTGNNSDRIIVRESANAQMRTHATWRNHGVPYELTGGVSVRTTDLTTEPVTWTLEPGVTLLVHPGENLDIGSTTDATLHAVGTVNEPIIITRLDAVADFWGQLKLDSNTDHTLENVEITWGGKTANPSDSFGMIRKTLNGTLNMTNVRLEHSQSSGMEIWDGGVYLRDSVITNNPQVGIYLCCGAGASIRNSEIYNNLTGGILNYWPNENCIDAVGNYWGDADGPADIDGTADACGNGGTNAGSGDQVSSGVVYRPWLSSAGGVPSNHSKISIDPLFIIADGVEKAEIKVTLRDLLGAPLAGKTVELQSTVGSITQPLQASDANGQVTAYISSDITGFSTVTAANLSDNDQVAGVGGVSFWQGSGDTGGLIDPNGVPYAKPELLIDRPPFIAGFPMEFSLPMQNTQPNSLDVEVIYGVTNLNIGVRFTPVFTAQKTLLPGERWNAPGVYVPSTSGHQCVQAKVAFDDGLAVRGSGSSSYQKNTDKNPCDDLNPFNLVPRGIGLRGVQKHTKNATKEASKANKCIADQVSFGSDLGATRAASPAGDFDQVFVPPVLTPPQVSAGGEITAGLAAAMNDLATIGGRISALITANGATRQRLQWAGQASDQASINLQYDAFRNYSLWEGQKLLELASALDVYLGELTLEGIEDVLMTVDDQIAYLEMLKTTGFEQETIDYLLTSGWSMNEVNQRLAQTIAEYEASDFASISFTDAMRVFRDKAIAQGNDLVSRYGGSVTRAAGGGDILTVDPMSWEFLVGHDYDTEKTVELIVKPLSLPVNWSYELSDRVVQLESAETKMVTLRVYPGPDSLSGEIVNVAVEGYVSDELIGGIAFEYYVPRLFTSINCTSGDIRLQGPVAYLNKDLSREEAGGNISTQGDVVLEPGSTVTYMAGGSITLSPGFRAQTGSTFTAANGPVTCVTGP